MSSNPTIHFNARTFDALANCNDRVTYAIARQTLDMVGHQKVVAYKSGDTEGTMYSNGVQEDSQGYYIGNFTPYASRVYRMGEGTNWTRKTTRPQWFHSIWNEYGEMITENCIRRYLKEI